MRTLAFVGSSLFMCALVACSSDATSDGTTTSSSATDPSGTISGGATGPAPTLAVPADDAGAPVGFAYHGTLSTDAPTQAGYFTPNGGHTAPPSCANPVAARAVVGKSAEVHYDAHTFHNTTGQDACVTVQFEVDDFPTAGSGGLPEFVAYVGAFDETAITIDYAAAVAGIVKGDFSFMVPAGAAFAIVVAAPVEASMLTPDAAPSLSRTYSLGVSGY